MSDTINPITVTERVASRPLWAAPLVQAVVSGFIGALVVATTAPVWRHANPTWRLTLPGVAHPGGSLFSAVSFVFGVALVGFGWFRLSGVMLRSKLPEAVRLRVSAQVLAVWALPIVLGPPLLSNDVYSYAAQGEIAGRGLDPTVVGPWGLGGGKFLQAADDVWHYNPSPYGPLWNKLSAALVGISGHDPARAVWAFRLVIVAAVVLSGWAVVRIARQLGVDPAAALVLAVGNPVVLLHFVGGIHNDALMMALLLVGLALLGDRHRVLAFLALSAALAIKLPAVVGLAYLGWVWVEAPSTWLRRAGRAAVTTIGGFALVVAMSVQFHMSQGWVTALQGTGKVKTTFAPSTMAGLLASGVLHWFRFAVGEDTVVGLFRTASLFVAAGIGWLLLSHAQRLGTELAVGLTLLAAIGLGPVLWPWYLPPALALLAVHGAERVRPALSVWCVALSLFVFPTSVGSGVGSAMHTAIVGAIALSVITAVAVSAQWMFGQPLVPAPVARWWDRLQARRNAVEPA